MCVGLRRSGRNGGEAELFCFYSHKGVFKIKHDVDGVIECAESKKTLN